MQLDIVNNTMINRHLSVFITCLALAWPAMGQSLVLSAYKTKCDTLTTLIKDKTTVSASIKLQSVMRRNGFLDFYFTTGIGDIPWTKSDVEWLKSTLHEIAPDGYGHYKIGTVYCGRTPLSEIALAPAGNDGKPKDHQWKTRDPLSSDGPALVREEGGQEFSKGLSGRHVALWQSHGRYYEEATRRWEWQRAPLFTTVEDMYTQSYVLPFLIPMLENAGAYVMTPRERDTQKYEVIIDNDPAFQARREGLLRRSGKYSESGSWSNAGTGFADFKEIYSGDDNPFTAGTVRKASCKKDSAADAVATWTPDIPERGQYAVYVSYKSLPNSTESAHYSVTHLGGTSHFLVNQKMGGGTWIYLGTFEFGKDSGCKVTLDNGTRKGELYRQGTVVTADAVKIGGGMGKISRGNADMSPEEYTTSGLPSFTEGALYWMQWAGTDTSVIRRFSNDYTNDYGDRGAWVSMMSGGSRVNPKSQGKGIPFDMSFAFHTDAGTTPGDSIVGTLSIYTLICDGSRKYADGEDRILGRMLAGDIQEQITNDVRTQFEPQWSRRQLADRSYSESRTTGVPGSLLELLSHQNFADMKYGLDPSFRFTVSRAIYKGMLKFMSSRYGFHYAVQPLPVRSFAAVLKDSGTAVLSWKETADTLEPTAKATGFILYTRKDGGAFDGGQIIHSVQRHDGSFSTSVPVSAGHLYSYRIVAFNEGGRSFPSETLSLGAIGEGKVNADETVLVVNNFDRVAPPAWFDTPEYAGFDEMLDGGVAYMNEINHIGQMYQFRRDMPWTDDDNPGFGASYTDHAGEVIKGNTFDYPAVHGKALMAAGYSFCSASAEAFAEDSTMLDGYWATDIICGKQVSTPAGRGAVNASRFQVLPKQMRRAIKACTERGGNILISGANIGTDLWDEVYPVGRDSLYQAEARKFAMDVLGYKWLTNYASRCGRVKAARSKAMETSSLSQEIDFNQNSTDHIYKVETPDGLLPASGKASSFLRYADTDISAGVCNEGKGYRSVSVGFPIETITDESMMTGMMKAIMDFFAKGSTSR